MHVNVYRCEVRVRKTAQISPISVILTLALHNGKKLHIHKHRIIMAEYFQRIIMIWPSENASINVSPIMLI